MAAIPETIVAAAIIRHTGDVFSLPRPARHHTLIHYLAAEGDPVPINGEQGFITNRGRFVDRETALLIAQDAGQVGSTSHDRLFSEDLW